MHNNKTVSLFGSMQTQKRLQVIEGEPNLGRHVSHTTINICDKVLSVVRYGLVRQLKGCCNNVGGDIPSVQHTLFNNCYKCRLVLETQELEPSFGLQHHGFYSGNQY